MKGYNRDKRNAFKGRDGELARMDTLVLRELPLPRGYIVRGASDNSAQEYDASTDGYILIGDGNDLASVAVSGDISITKAGVVSIASGVIVNADVKSDAAIAWSKMAALTSGQILVGNGSNVATDVAMSGDIAIDNTGLTTIQAGAVDIAMLASATNRQFAQIFIPSALTNFPAPAGGNDTDNDSLMGFYCPRDITINAAYLMIDTAIAIGDADDHLEFNLSDGANELLSANVSAEAGVSQYAAITLTCDQNNDLSAGDILYVRIDVFDDGADGDPPTDLSGATCYLCVDYSLR